MSENISDKTKEIKGPETKLMIFGFFKSSLRMFNRVINAVAGGVPAHALVVQEEEH